MNSLKDIIKNLKAKSEVDAVFLTGSHGLGNQKTYSDIDLVVVLKNNSKDIKSVYTWIDGKFADIFFFDHKDLKRISALEDLPANEMDGILVSWFQKASIQFDKSGKTTKLMNNIKKFSKFTVPVHEQMDFWHKINYNYVANTRYYKSKDPLYHAALEIRLLYSVLELIVGYFSLRNIPWRGEKNAIKYFKENDPNYYSIFIKYTKAKNLKERFQSYKKLVTNVFPKTHKFWKNDDVIVNQRNKDKSKDKRSLQKYWNNLIA